MAANNHDQETRERFVTVFETRGIEKLVCVWGGGGEPDEEYNICIWIDIYFWVAMFIQAQRNNQ